MERQAFPLLTDSIRDSIRINWQLILIVHWIIHSWNVQSNNSNSASPCLIVDNKVVLSYTGEKKQTTCPFKTWRAVNMRKKKLAWLEGWPFNGRVTLLAGPTILHIINTLAYLAESTQSMPERRCCLLPRAKWSTFSSLKRSPNLIWLGEGGWRDPLSLGQLSSI